MNEHYIAFVDLGRQIASERGIKWDVRLRTDGAVFPEDSWNLTEMVADTPPPTHCIRDLGADTKTLDALNKLRAEENLPPISKTALTIAWQDFIKAAIMEQLFFRRNTTGHVMNNVVRPLRVLATCMQDRPPWELRTEDVMCAHQVARSFQPSGQLADVVIGVTKTIIDANHISNASPLSPTLSLPRLNVREKRAKHTKSPDQLRQNLEDRKSAEKLPERRAFWELVRIVFTEQPKSFLDVLRFSQVKVLLLCGLRIGEVTRLPADWKRTREYYDASGKPAGELGGYSHALMLRHFAEKQQTANSDSIVLYESAQYVPAMFEEILCTTLDQVAKATRPLRDTLRRQIEDGRILPWFKPDELIPVIRLYPYLSGNPILLPVAARERDKDIARYREAFDPAVLDEIHRTQLAHFNGGNLDIAVYQYYNRMKGKITFRDVIGTPLTDSRMRWAEVFLRIDEVEDYIRAETPTKLSDTTAFRLETGELQPWDLLFLMPKRALAEGRNDGLCDITRYFSVGRVDPSMLQNTLAGSTRTRSVPTLFEVYGQTDEDRELTLTPHSLRHLQNTELFRLGVADTIISKRFNRRSVTQSYEYDHRRLVEELEQTSIPPEVEISLGDKAATVARMIQAGRANGPIVQAFKKIQREQGEDAAFTFLKAEADGFHSTPYGHCLNSFTVDPCPKHLECFAGCRHLSATNLPENRRHLVQLEARLKQALEAVEARPSTTIGRENQIRHAKERLIGVRKLLETPAGQMVFPGGPDVSGSERTKRTALDGDQHA